VNTIFRPLARKYELKIWDEWNSLILKERKLISSPKGIKEFLTTFIVDLEFQSARKTINKVLKFTIELK